MNKSYELLEGSAYSINSDMHRLANEGYKVIWCRPLKGATSIRLYAALMEREAAPHSEQGTPLDTLYPLTMKHYNAFRRAGYNTAEEVLALDRSEFEGIIGIGPSGRTRFVDACIEHGLIDKTHYFYRYRS